MVAMPLVENEIPALDEVAVYRKRESGELVRTGKSFGLIDAFSGAGGMTLGFTAAFGHNFRPLWANDFNEHAAASYNRNFGDHCVLGDIIDLLDSPHLRIPKADVVIGGPPCQGFSLLNRKRANDPRRQLWRPYLEIEFIEQQC